MGFLAPAHGEIRPGAVLSWSRRYTPQDLEVFDVLSGRVPSPDGAGILPDLLVAAPLTKLGGDLDYIARKMVWTHARPVAVTEELTAELRVLSTEEQPAFHRITFGARVWVGEELVLDGHSKGVVLKGPPGEAPGDAPGAEGPRGAGTAAGPGDRGGRQGAGRIVRPPADDPVRPPAVPLPLDRIVPGAVLRHGRTVTDADITRCADLTGDHGDHHVKGVGGRRMAQGLLTAATVPLLRGDGGFRFRSVSMVFLNPVFAGESLDAEARIEGVADGTDGTSAGAAPAAGPVSLAGTVRDASGTEVLVAECAGSFS